MSYKYCDCCHKEIKRSDYLVHVRYLTFRGIANEYYHKSCYERNHLKIWKHAESIR